MGVLKANRAVLVEQDAPSQRLRQHRQIRTSHRRFQEHLRGACAAAVADGEVGRAETFLLESIVVGCMRMSRSLAGLHVGAMNSAAVVRLRYGKRATGAVKVVGTGVEIFRALEVGQHVRVGPAAQPDLAPLVVVARMTPAIHHAVDRGRSAKHFAARKIDRAAAHIRLGLGFIAPIEPHHGHQVAKLERKLQPDVAVGLSRFQQQDLDTRVLGKPARRERSLPIRRRR